MGAAAWTEDDLQRVQNHSEIQLASRRPDGSLRPYTTIWVVCAAEWVYVRSAYGYDNGWFQRALRSGSGRIRIGGIERDVAFEQPDSSVDPEVTAGYHAKYDRYGPSIVGTVVSPEAERSTLRLMPLH